MKQFKFIPKEKLDKIPKERYPDINSVYLDGDDFEVHKDFFSFKNGVIIPDWEKQERINEIVDYFNENPEEGDYSISSGNNMVLGINREHGIEIYIIDSYMSGYIER